MRLLFADRLSDETVHELEARGHTCVVEPGLSADDLPGRIPGFDGLVVRSTKVKAPVFEAASEEHPDAVFGKVDTEAEQELAGALQIQSIPTLMIFRDGILMFSQPGALPKATLDDLIAQVEALDMDEVRAQIGEAPVPASGD